MSSGWVVGLLLLVGCQAPAPVQQARPREGEARRERPGRVATAGFDYYLLNLSWSPEYCHSHPGAEQCAEHQSFVLHGLWPENEDGTYPENCSGTPGPEDVGRYAGLYPDAGLLEHEWRSHGTCSGLGADGYFETVARAKRSIRIPPALSRLRAPTSVPPEEIVGMFTAANPGLPAESLVVSCGNNYLTAVEVCLDKGLRPVRCGEVRSCRANAVRVPAP